MIENITADERAAMRAYVLRMEVRLSTLHRIAGLFIFLRLCQSLSGG